MRSAPSATFRRLSLALALLAVTWAFPGSIRGDFYPLQTVKTVTDTLKPNILVLLETAESMQGLPGESPARYNSVGADCEEGSRYCRLTNQDGRYAFSGMGQNGVYFGGTPPGCTHTQTTTTTNFSYSQTSTTSCTGTSSGTAATSVAGAGTGTGSGTGIKTVTGTGVANAVATATASGSIVVPATVTGIASATASSVAYPPGTGTATGTPVNNATGTKVVTATTTKTSAAAVVLTDTVTATSVQTLTGTITSTTTATLTMSAAAQTATATGTVSSPVTITGTVTRTGTVTGAVNATASDTGTVTGLVTLTSTAGPTSTATGTGTGSYLVTNPAGTAVFTGNAGVYTTVTNGTVTPNQTITANTVTATTTKTGTGTGTITMSGSQTVVATALGASIAGAGTSQATGYLLTTPSGTSSTTAVTTYPGSASATFVWTFGGVSGPSPGPLTTQSTSGTSVTGPPNQVASFPSGVRFTATGRSVGTSTQTVTATGSFNQAVNNVSWTVTFTGTSNARTGFNSVTGIWTDTQNSTMGTVPLTGTKYTTGTVAFATATQTAVPTSTNTQTVTLGASSPKTATVTGTVTGTTTVSIASSNVTGSATVTASGNATGTGRWTGSVTVTGSGAVSATGTQTVSGSATASATASFTGTISASGTISTSTSTASCSSSATLTGTSTQTVLTSATAIATVTDCTTSGGSDLGRCDKAPTTPTTNGYCNNDGTGASCNGDDDCAATRGAFCRRIAILDDLKHPRAETCFASPGSSTAWGSCKRGRATANTDCGPVSSTSCNAASDQDFCAEGKPAKMCRDTGLWCSSSLNCDNTDACVPASSRMMTVKGALRRAVTEYADKVNFGFMNTYQAPTVPNGACTDPATCIYPYVKLASCPAIVDVTEIKLFTRGELERLGAFTLLRGTPIPADGPASSFAWNGVTYTKTAVSGNVDMGDTGTGDSRWVISRGDGSGKFNHYTANWASCPGSSKPDMRPACDLGTPGTGIYEGSYYTFSYKRGTPVADGSSGSMQQPMYSSSFLGKYYYVDATHCYNLVDAERTDIVNDGIYNRKAYVLSQSATSPYTGTGTATGIDTSKETYVDPPWTGAASVASCNSASGAIWNSNAVPFLNQTGTTTATGTATDRSIAIAARLDKASLGGVAAVGNSPIGCALSNEGAGGVAYGASAYMNQVMANDSTNNGGNAPCWTNNIILVVDGHSNGPGDEGVSVDCASNACTSATPTEAGGCHCPAINKAYTLAQAGVETHVVVNAPASWSTATASYSYPYYTYAFLWNLALAGSRNAKFSNANAGTPSIGTSEEEVYKGLTDKIAAAAYHFTYTTAGAVAGATTQDPTTQILSYSSTLYDTSISYPSWKGTVRAFDTTGSVGLTWDAATVAASGKPGWKNRRIYFSTKGGTIAKVDIDSSTGAINNASTLHSAGLGATDTEAGIIMQWLLGKPELGNLTPLMGSLSSSTPIVVGQPAANGLNGSTPYSQNKWKRPPLVYVGADDGMLHAFFAHSGTKNYAGVDYSGGEEAFAFIPNDMLPVIAKLYAQGGQKLPFDKNQHVFGLAASPKVKDMCKGPSCSASDGSDWHTVLVMPEGPGGNKVFALDITNVIDATDGLQPASMSLLWSTALKAEGSTDGVKLPTATDGQKWDQSMGETTSVPSFYFSDYVAGSADNRVLIASGYPVRTRTGSYISQGLSVMNADALTGAFKETLAVPAAQTTCSNTRAVLADIALARDYASASTSQNVMGAYFADTWGNAFQYVPSAHAVTTLYHAGTSGCDQPIYYSPAVVQLDRAPRADTSSKHFIYLVQVTGSALDPTSSTPTVNYPASQLIVTKLDGNVTPPTIVTSYNPLTATGQVILSASTTALAATRICIQSDNSTAFTGTMKSSTQSCSDAGGTPLPETARPIATPTVALRGDGLGFQAITAWYDPTAITNNCSTGNSFNYGKSYVTVHEFGADGTWYQIAGVTLNNTALTGIAFIGTGLFVDGLINSATPTSISIGETFSTMQQVLNNNNGLERYLRSSWTERVDL